MDGNPRLALKEVQDRKYRVERRHQGSNKLQRQINQIDLQALPKRKRVHYGPELLLALYGFEPIYAQVAELKIDQTNNLEWNPQRA
jgi:hypothetical protein